MTTTHPSEAARFIILILINIPEVVSAEESSYRMLIVGDEGVTEEGDAEVLSFNLHSLRELHVFLPTLL